MNSSNRHGSAKPDTSPVPEFQTTRWTVLLDADADETAVRNQALNELYLKYRPPLLRYVERKWPSLKEDAQDLFHDFLLKAIDKKYLGRASRDRGRFRTFLLTLFSRFLKDEWQRRQATIRKPNFDHAPLEPEALGIVHDLEPDHELMDYEWGIHMIHLVQSQLKAFYNQKGKLESYAVLRRYLTVKAKLEDLEQSAALLQISVSAVRSEIHRLRKQHESLLEETVRETLGPNESIHEEIQHLIKIVTTVHRRSIQEN